MKYRRILVDTARDWSDWISPTRKRPYRMACCGCGMVHDLEFTALEVEREASNGWWSGKALTVPYRIVFRARLNQRETDKLRASEAA